MSQIKMISDQMEERFSGREIAGLIEGVGVSGWLALLDQRDWRSLIVKQRADGCGGFRRDNKGNPLCGVLYKIQEEASHGEALVVWSDERLMEQVAVGGSRGGDYDRNLHQSFYYAEVAP